MAAGGAPCSPACNIVTRLAVLRGRGNHDSRVARRINRAHRQRARRRHRRSCECHCGVALLGLAHTLRHLRAASPAARRTELPAVGPYIAIEATRALLVEHRAETTWLGIGLSIGTLCVCPWQGRAKLRLGEQLGSPATAGEGRQNLICAYLAIAVLAGLLSNTLLGIWWLDPIVALGIAGLALFESRRSWRGDSCDCGGCAPPTLR